MTDFLLAMLVLYVIAVIIVSIVSLLLLGDVKICLLTPSEIYENTNLNWFGCVFIWFLEFLINPFVWIGILVVRTAIWLFTVGRK